MQNLVPIWSILLTSQAVKHSGPVFLAILYIRQERISLALYKVTAMLIVVDNSKS